MISRRNLISSMATTASLSSLGMSPLLLAQESGTKLILLGTQGGPNYNLERGETATLLMVDGVPYLIDCGYGTFRSLKDIGVNFLTIPEIFLTHLHDDHVSDVATILSHQWTQGRIDQTTVHGPFGTDVLVNGAMDFSKGNGDIRLIDEGRSIRADSLFRANVVPATFDPFTVFEDERIKVSSVENTHFPLWAKAQMQYRSLSYRFDTAEHSIVFSGDTTYSENLVNLAKDADVLVVEVIEPVILRQWFDEVVANGGYQDNPENIWTHIVETHLTTEDAGRMANEANVENLVLNHLLPGALMDVDDSLYIEGIRTHYNDRVIVGTDLMEITVN